MANGLGVAVIHPAANGMVTVACQGAVPGAAILQVLNLVTGADVTSSFDPYIPAVDTIVQLDTNPVSIVTHLVTFQIPGGDPVTTRFAVVNSLGDTPGVHGGVAAPPVRIGDTIVRAMQPVTNPAFGNAVDVTTAFAPTVTTRSVVTQIAPLDASDSVLLLLRNAGAAAPVVEFSTNNGITPGIWSVPNAQLGAQVVRVLDLTSGNALTAHFGPLVPMAGSVYQADGPTISSVALILFRRQGGA